MKDDMVEVERPVLDMTQEPEHIDWAAQNRTDQVEWLARDLWVHNYEPGLGVDAQYERIRRVFCDAEMFFRYSDHHKSELQEAING